MLHINCVWYADVNRVVPKDPREQPAVPAQAAADPHVTAVGALHQRQRYLDGVSQ